MLGIGLVLLLLQRKSKKKKRKRKKRPDRILRNRTEQSLMAIFSLPEINTCLRFSSFFKIVNRVFLV